MIVIVASRADASARRLRDRWAGVDAQLFTCEDLSVSGWRYRVSDPLNATAIIGGSRVKPSEIQGVFTRLQWVSAGELMDIVCDDRAYVAAEMSAFLICWLSGLTCPMLNRPTASSLTGPGWSRERWNHAAAKAGMRIAPIRRRANLANSASHVDPPETLTWVKATVVGDRCLGAVHETLRGQARRLAGIAKVEFLEVHFRSAQAGAEFVGVDVFPDIDNENIADAALSYFTRG